MLKKVFAGMLAAVFIVMLAGCSGYKMTEKDMALQRSIKGFWVPDDSTGYNVYDENGEPVELLVVEFTDDFNYFIHTCYVQNNYIMTDPPIYYSFKNEKFKVDVDGVPSYALVHFSDDGKIMKWVTDDKTDTYNRISESTARAMGIPQYNREAWTSNDSGE